VAVGVLVAGSSSGSSEGTSVIEEDLVVAVGGSTVGSGGASVAVGGTVVGVSTSGIDAAVCEAIASGSMIVSSSVGDGLGGWVEMERVQAVNIRIIRNAKIMNQVFFVIVHTSL
jgi:hypothetical protein